MDYYIGLKVHFVEDFVWTEWETYMTLKLCIFGLKLISLSHFDYYLIRKSYKKVRKTFIHSTVISKEHIFVIK